jgi:hypothetical protein
MVEHEVVALVTRDRNPSVTPVDIHSKVVRLTAGHRTLTPGAMVRIHYDQPIPGSVAKW